MIYVDTNVLVSYVNPRDSLHTVARDYVSRFRDRYRLVVSPLTIVELFSVYSRKMDLSDVELEALVEYTIRSVGVSVLEIRWEDLVKQAMEYANRLKLRTLDLLHIVAAKIVGAKAILTFDRDIADKSSVVKEVLQLEVCSPYTP